MLTPRRPKAAAREAAPFSSCRMPVRQFAAPKRASSAASRSRTAAAYADALARTDVGAQHSAFRAAQADDAAQR